MSKENIPYVIRAAIDSIPPATYKEAVRKAGAFPPNRLAIEQSLIFPEPEETTTTTDPPAATGGPAGDVPGTPLIPTPGTDDDTAPGQSTTSTPDSCSKCGKSLVHPLVRAGLVPQLLAKAFFVPEDLTLDAPAKKKRRVVPTGRVITGQDWMKERREKEEAERAKKAAGGERKLAREEKKTEEELLRKKRRREDDETDSEEEEQEDMYACDTCGEVQGEITWVQCDRCETETWHCLPCTGLSEQEAEEIEEYICQSCKD